MRTAFKYLTSLLFLAVVVQVGFAGYGAFDAIDRADDGSITKQTVENGFDPHGALGTIVVLLLLVTVLAAAVGRLGPTLLWWTAGLFALGIVQMLLAWGATGAAWVGFLHGVNALAIYAGVAMLAHRTWGEGRVASEAWTAPSASQS
jgi:hypothetical protein